ncbi:SDR family oxidoreductase [Parvularcula lutaonensis]|uniref:SDR family oxidoreductase n=1 Tax=Parvularcula lutaonensis TaxID=491923 RepID=A0ABV7MEP8_9PROT|nr:NAD(P)H-binding protein [Parvularcula lutaonensis]GGY52393.1 hypothetical protein GCM10007148_21860 [Parvularcula lutaonensis]
MKVLVSGTTGAVGHEVAGRLEGRGAAVTRASRKPAKGLRHKTLDLTDEAGVRAAAQGHDAAILAPILSVSAPAARWLTEEGVRRIVVFSSNNVGIDADSPVYRALAEAERTLSGIDAEITILRPTMIYGHAGDGNIATLMRFALKYGFLPCPGSGRALQQPVFYEDVAEAAVQAVMAADAGVFAVAGSEALPQKELFSRVLGAVRKGNGAVLTVPLAALRAAAKAAEAVGLKLPLSTAQLARFERDKTPTLPQLPGFAPSVSLSEGLERLAEDLADTASEG